MIFDKKQNPDAPDLPPKQDRFRQFYIASEACCVPVLWQHGTWCNCGSPWKIREIPPSMSWVSGVTRCTWIRMKHVIEGDSNLNSMEVWNWHMRIDGIDWIAFVESSLETRQTSMIITANMCDKCHNEKPMPAKAFIYEYPISCVCNVCCC